MSQRLLLRLEKPFERIKIMASDILTLKELGKRWYVPTTALRYWRWKGTGPALSKLFKGK